MKGKIAVTPRSLSRRGHPALEELCQADYAVFFPTPGKQPSEEEVAAFLPACVGYLAGVEPIPTRVLNQCPDLKVISRNGVGVDNIDVDAARSLGIAVEIAVGANSQGVAELAITLMMAGLRHVPRSNGQLKRGVWERHIGIEIKERTLGVVGCGQIGKKVVEMEAPGKYTARSFRKGSTVDFPTYLFHNRALTCSINWERETPH